ncbi:maestro heat-like repeat-containing protein family member 2B [Gymnogyps californianus]|uniref:maestro heat-like repeat-containing protein family member 2B n=1 Tax=Gymnogyps californianus TaxID=33616 RepID=UPI0021C68FDF|nr:maestro heat-like repeat-containing protein family member 2B [Gymnogyps californianus]
MALAISTAVHRQLSDVTKEPGPAHKAVLSHCMVLQARSCPEEAVVFLHCQLSGGSEAGRVAALGLLGALAHSDAPAMREKLPQVVEAVRSVCNDPSAQVRRAVLEFIRELLSSGSQSCWAWDVVGHIFTEFSRASGRLVAGGLFAWETQEDGALRALCVDILGSLDVSRRGMTKLLWPRLLQYVLPAQYSGMLIPLSRCLRALVERREKAGCKEGEEEPDAMDSQKQACLPAPQALLARLLVVAAAPYTSGERAVAALQLLQALHGRVHRALGAAWATEVPLLLQYLEGKTESSLDSAEWEHRVLKFLQASLEPIEDKAWTLGLSQELSQQLGSSAAGSWEKFFLYKALGTTLAACRDLRHVQGQVLRFLQETNPVELSEAQGMISVVSHAAERHFHLVLDTMTMFSAAFTRGWFYQTSMGWKVQRRQKTERDQAIRAALMRTYSGIALHAPKEQLLTRVDKEIMGNILRLSRAKQRDLHLKLALVQSITEVSCAIQAVGDCGSFELSLKQEATRTLLDWIKGEPWDSLVYGVFHALEKLSKLRPPLSREENRKLLAVCCQSVLSYPSEEQMKKGRKTVRAAVNMQLLHRRGMEDLGQLTESLLEAEATCFDDVVHVLKGWLTSAKEWERERALRVCAHVLGACKERFEGCPCKQFGSLVGLLGSLTSDCLATSQQRAWLCLGYLLQMQAKTMKVVPQAHEIRCLCEELNSPDTETLLETGTKIAKAVCKCIPPAQATDFLTAVLDSLLHVTPTRAKAVRKWVFVFLVECRKEILQEVPKILNTLYAYMQQSTHRPFLLRAVFLLAQFHQEPVISSLLQKGLPMDSDTVELWRSLGRSIFGIQILRCLVEKLNRAGNNRLRTDSSTCERHNRQTALETLTITRAISEVVLALSSTEELRQLLPHLLPSLLRWASETLGEERLLSPMSSWRQLFLEGQVLEEKPCRIFLSALELVLGKCMAQKWMRLLVNQAVWARLEDPLAYPEGVRLLSSVLLHAGLVSPCLVKNLLPWLHSRSVKLRVTATAFFAESPEEAKIFTRYFFVTTAKIDC